MASTGGQSHSIVFALPPGGQAATFAEHLGTAFLRTMLARAGIRSTQVRPDRNVSLATFGRFVAQAAPRVFGLTAYESNLPACRALARVVREASPETIVLVGGPNATFTPEETLELVGADVCVRGAAEGTIVPIAQAILGAERPRARLPELLARVPNLVVAGGPDPRHTRRGNLSSFPSEHFRCVDDIPSPYQAGFVTTADVGLLTARGCNQHCTYCSFAAISGRRVHLHSVERVLDDLRALAALEGAPPGGSLVFNDDAFTLSPERARRICEGILASGLRRKLVCETRADRVDPELLGLMRRAGFESVTFGLESAVPRVLRTIGKVQDPGTRDDPGLERERQWLEQFRRAVRWSKEAGLLPVVSIIAGLPGESADDLRATLAFVEELELPQYVHNVLWLFPGTPLHRDRASHGLDAARDGGGRWRTRHAYDVAAVSPLANASTLGEGWDEASLISDALCGVPRSDRAEESAPWAAVIHAAAPDPVVVAWLARVLAVHAVIVVVEPAGAAEPPDVEEWLGVLHQAAIAADVVSVLRPEGALAGATVLASQNTLGEHRFVLDPTWRADARVEADARGCRVPIWVASAASAPPPEPTDAVEAFRPRAPIADGCRWWSGWRRCARPRVLHVRADRTVATCWHGPAIGRIGDPWDELAARARTLAGGAGDADSLASEACPLPRSPRDAARAGTQTYEIGAQLQWFAGAAGRRGMNTTGRG